MQTSNLQEPQGRVQPHLEGSESNKIGRLRLFITDDVLPEEWAEVFEGFSNGNELSPIYHYFR